MSKRGRASPSGAAGAKRSRASSAEAAGAGGAGGTSTHSADPPAAAVDFLEYVDGAPSPFHAVAITTARLIEAGYTRLREDEEWGVPGESGSKVQPGGKYFITRNQSALVAFSVGGAYKPGNGVAAVAAHTDSPCLKVKPRSALKKGGCLAVGVQTYGGGIWHTWFDRDLGVAGRAVVRGDDGAVRSSLVRIDRPLMRVPTIAIHLDREVNSVGMKINNEDHLAALLATEAVDALTRSAAGVDACAGGGDHHPGLVEALADELGCEPEAIVDFELCLYDVQGSAIGGLHNEFIYAPRLDNLMSCYTGLRGLLEADADDSFKSDPCIRMLACFDNEEVGSNSMAGAGSSMLAEVFTRLATPALAPIAARRSLLVSADMAHALHPNYPGRHSDLHKPSMQGGLVLKHNANQRYATMSHSAYFIREAAKIAKAPVQEFVVRQDMACGSTVRAALPGYFACP